MNWEDILKESEDKVNDMLHDFFVEMYDRMDKIERAKFSTRLSPRMVNVLEEIKELTEKLADKLEDVLEPYFKRLQDE